MNLMGGNSIFKSTHELNSTRSHLLIQSYDFKTLMKITGVITYKGTRPIKIKAKNKHYF